jgi:hypothetical protein
MLIAASLLAATAVPASAATVLFSQNFDTVTAGLQIAAVPGFTITGGVDVVNTNTFSIDCVGNTGRCLDLAGSPGPGTITTTAINFAAGQLVTVSFDVSGNQRTGATDTFTLLGAFTPSNGGTTNVLSGPAAFSPGAWANALNGTQFVESIVGTRGFVTYSATFRPILAGSFKLAFGGTGSNASIGPIIDNVLVTQAVPEPASWAMLITGFGMVGFAARRRRTAIAA